MLQGQGKHFVLFATSTGIGAGFMTHGDFLHLFFSSCWNFHPATLRHLKLHFCQFFVSFKVISELDRFESHFPDAQVGLAKFASWFAGSTPKEGHLHNLPHE